MQSIGVLNPSRNKIIESQIGLFLDIKKYIGSCRIYNFSKNHKSSENYADTQILTYLCLVLRMINNIRRINMAREMYNPINSEVVSFSEIGPINVSASDANA